ncbi:hypothetical protein WJX73_004197 [Symbiochloris irregularis]|uniref:Ribosomal protein/NADH dehydrogenase domain-containing protein n=1 Tax=Symbiochloris irregularis TaxID=706552 RepID=A0AAW1PUB7_9CHLO
MAWRASLSKNLQELRIQLCQTGPASEGAREFVLGSYQELKKANPNFPILVRECVGAPARLVARYDFGKEESVTVDGLDKSAISKKLQDLIAQGEKMPRSAESEGKL